LPQRHKDIKGFEIMKSLLVIEKAFSLKDEWNKKTKHFTSSLLYAKEEIRTPIPPYPAGLPL